MSIEFGPQCCFDPMLERLALFALSVQYLVYPFAEREGPGTALAAQKV